MKLQKVLLSIICVVAILLAIPLSASAISFNAEEKYNSVFVITSGDSLGSGFAIGENCIITNAHVIGNSKNIQLATQDGKRYKAKLIGMDEDKDIAVLSVSGVKFIPLKVADYDALKVGTDVYAIGAPKSMAYTLTKGVVSAKDRKIGGHSYIQTDAAINEGNSGGPLIDDEGNVIGVNTLKLNNSEGIGLAIPMTVVCAFVESLNIQTDENGNVKGIVNQGEDGNNPETTTQAPNKEPYKPVTPKEPQYNLALAIGLGVSVILNIVFIIMLVYRSRKKANIMYDPSERTDFEIDILE